MRENVFQNREIYGRQLVEQRAQRQQTTATIGFHLHVQRGRRCTAAAGYASYAEHNIMIEKSVPGWIYVADTHMQFPPVPSSDRRRTAMADALRKSPSAPWRPHSPECPAHRCQCWHLSATHNTPFNTIHPESVRSCPRTHPPAASGTADRRAPDCRAPDRCPPSPGPPAR